jgi:hypothetical protein
MNIYKVIVFIGVGYVVYKNRDKILAKAKQIGVVTVVADPANEWTPKP